MSDKKQNTPKEEAEELVNNFYDLGLFAVSSIETQSIAVEVRKFNT